MIDKDSKTQIVAAWAQVQSPQASNERSTRVARVLAEMVPEDVDRVAVSNDLQVEDLSPAAVVVAMNHSGLFLIREAGDGVGLRYLRIDASACFVAVTEHRERLPDNEGTLRNHRWSFKVGGESLSFSSVSGRLPFGAGVTDRQRLELEDLALALADRLGWTAPMLTERSGAADKAA